jgi:hypothetical protein
MTGAGGYVRPPIAPAVFVDDLGRPYGERWGMVATPEDSCSVVSHPERFAPLHEVADALVDWLRATFVVQVEEGAELAADLLHPQPSVLRAVRLTPAHPDAASLGPAGLDGRVLDAARPTLDRLPGGWAAWPRRAGTEDDAR